VNGRRGYTLMEMLLVLAILVVAAAVSAPALRGVMRNAELRAAAETVRAQWTRAHVAAMKTGRIQVFHYEIGGRKYKTTPWMSDDDALESAAGESPSGFSAPIAAGSAEFPTDKELPEGAKFVGGDMANDNRSLTIETEIAQLSQDSVQWSRPILFYPDGTSSDAYVIVGNDFELGMRVELRGLTGVVKIGDIGSLAELEQTQQ
jgi:prepilin-type N-terminal cleavage/methylation domain-containing protein